jgi:hypothetical protein
MLTQGICLEFQNDLVTSFKKEHLLAKKGTSPSRGNVFTTHPKVKVIFWDKTGFWTRIGRGRRVIFLVKMTPQFLYPP